MIDLIILFVVVGVVLWAVNNYVPMQPQILKLLNVVVVVIMLIIALREVLPMVGVH